MKVKTLSLWTEGRSVISWKDWSFTRRQGKGNHWWKR